MPEVNAEIAELTVEFAACRRTLQALGDENRQHLILEMLKLGRCGGVRVGEITRCTHLSRPAVLIRMRREGTKNYYYFDADAKAVEELLCMLLHARSILKSLPDRSGACE